MNTNNLQSLDDRFSLGPTPPNGANLPSSLGSGTYQFLALTGTQQSANSNKPRKQQQQKYVRRPNYSNEDLVDDLSRGHNNQFNSQDEILFDEFAQGAVNQSDIMMGDIDYPQVPQNESNIYDNQESTDFINEPMTNAFGSQAEMDENEDISESMQEIPPPINEEEEQQEDRLESLKYIETTIDHQPMSHENSKNPIVIEDQQAQIMSQRVQFQEKEGIKNEELEETHDFPQIQHENNESIIENCYDNEFKNYSQQLFVGCLIKQNDKKIESKIQVNSLLRPRSARNSSVSKSLSFQDRGINNARPSLEIDANNIKETSLGLFTSNSPSRYLLKFIRNVGMSIDEARQILQTQDDIQTFIQTFDNDKAFLNVFGFDLCVNENYGHRQLNLNNQVVRFLSHDGTTQRHQSFKQSTNASIKTNSSLDHLPNDFVFLFGQHSASKSDVFNSLKPESLINRFIDTLQENIKFLRVSLFYQEQEYVITQRSFNQTNSGVQKRELQMDLRQAQRNKASLIKKVASTSRKLIADQERLNTDMKQASHYVIQINNHIFVDLGGIECLNSSANPLLVQSLTHNFGSVTNQILKLSPFYANHDFNPTDLQEQSLFNTYLKTQLTANSKVALLCCVSSDPKLNPQTMIALDYCHKIKCYFNGITEEEVKNRLKHEFDTSNVIEMARIHRLREIGGLYQTFWRIRSNKIGKRNRVTSPKTQMTIEGLKERALQISRMSEDPSGSTNDEKRMMTILLKEIEMFIANRNDITPTLNVTPIKSLNSIKSQGHLRMRTGSASRSSTSLAGPYILINQSNKRSKPSNNSSQKQKYRQQSRHFQSHVHMIPTASHDYENRSNRKSHNRSKHQSQKGSRASSTSRSPNVKRQRTSSKNSIGSRVMRPGSIENPNFSVEPTLFEDYNRQLILKGSETLQVDSRDTPQFQHDSLSHQLNNSSLYVRTSGPSSITGAGGNHRSRRTSNKGGFSSSQFNSLAPKLPQVNAEFYCETSDKKSFGGVRRVLSSTQKQRRQIITSYPMGGMQDSIRQIEDEQENSLNYSNQLPRLDLAVNSQENTNLQKEVALYKSQFETAQLNLQQLSEKFTQLEQTSLKHKQQYSNKLADFSNQLVDKDKIIQSLESQLDTSNKEIYDLRTQMDSLNHETAESQETQRLVIQQISKMKSVIEDQKESERDKEQLLIKLKAKDERIRELTKQLRNNQKQPPSNDREISQLQHENDLLNLQHAEKLEQFEQRFQKIYLQYKRAVEENRELLDANRQLQKQVSHAESAQENYKDQVIELKQELKRLRRNQTSRGRINEEATTVNNSRKENDDSQSTENNDKRKSRDKQKEVVLGDIRNLIQEYKKERTLANSSLTR